MADLVETMFSANNVVPWHQKGEILTGYPDINTAYDKSGLDWGVTTRKLAVIGDDGNIVSDVTVPISALVRDTDNRFLGSCSDIYRIFQNSEAFQWCKPLVESGEWVMETAGALKQGQLCWILLNQGSAPILPKDELKHYLLLTWAHDGRTSLQLGLTSIRVVCNNTLTQALKQDGTEMLRIRHNNALPLKLDEAHELYSATVKSFAEQTIAFGELADIEITDAQRDEYFEAVLMDELKIHEDDDLEEMSKRRKNNLDNMLNGLRWFADNGLGQKELKLQNNLWGCFNAVEAWAEKAKGGNRVKDRGYHILYGGGKALADHAFELAQSYK